MKKNNKLSKNTIANIIAKIWGFVSTLIFVPFYIDLLGEEQYGIVSFFIVLQALVNILGLGLSNTLRRSFATDDTSSSARIVKYKMYRGVEFIYIIIGVIVIISAILFSEKIAIMFLDSEFLDISITSNVVILMTISISIQMISYLIYGCILGLGYQVVANIYSVVWSLLKSVGSIVVLYLWRDIQIFYCWHIFIDALYFVLIRLFLIHSLKENDILVWSIKDFSILSSIWKYALGLSFISIVSIITKQFDKLIISKELSLAELGAYNTVLTLANIPQILISAISLALFTHFTNLFTSDNINSLNKDFSKFFKSSTIFIVSTSSFIAVFCNELILIWTNSKLYLDLLSGVSSFVILGSMFLAIQELPYNYLLSRGVTKINRIMSIISLPFIVIGSYIFVELYGLLGASLIYFLLMLIQTYLYLFYMHKRYIENNSFKWLNLNMVLPLVLSIVSALISRFLIVSLGLSLLLTVFLAIICGFITLFVLIIILDRELLSEIFKKK